MVLVVLPHKDLPYYKDFLGEDKEWRTFGSYEKLSWIKIDSKNRTEIPPFVWKKLIIRDIFIVSLNLRRTQRLVPHNKFQAYIRTNQAHWSKRGWLRLPQPRLISTILNQLCRLRTLKEGRNGDVQLEENIAGVHFWFIVIARIARAIRKSRS